MGGMKTKMGCGMKDGVKSGVENGMKNEVKNENDVWMKNKMAETSYRVLRMDVM